ncbi:hypothetical protein EGM51_11765 [Verrucomicrobia bacterium S94]|nr:hypothetical protein EGM51_11765 [Verrucomicrobia bacterium S94]
MRPIYLLTILTILVGCREQDPNKELMKEVAEAYQAGSKKILTEELSNENTEFIADTLELRTRCDQIMTHIGKGEIDKAFSEIKKYTFLPKQEMDAAQAATKKQISLTLNRFGDFCGYEFVSQKNVSPSLVKFEYIAKCENHPLVWRFMFYKADNKWTLNIFNWDDQIQTLN